MRASAVPVILRALLAGALSLFTLSAAAQTVAELPAPDRPLPAPSPDVWASVQRPWLYAPDPSAAPVGHVLATLGAGYAQIDRGAARPFAGNVAQAGGVFSAGAEVGVLRVLSVQAEGLLAGDGSSINGGAMLGVTLHPFPVRWPVSSAFSAGYLRELGGANGAWGRATIAGDLGPVRLSVSALGSHLFADKRDGLDLLLSAGASYRLNDILRLGVEYVVQDLEEAIDEEAIDGGVRHFLGPSVGLRLARRVQITAGPAFGLSKGAPAFQGRMAASYAF
ncbi:MAG: hypothetical protein ABI193_18035 [Minicystis sp.]